MNLKKHIISLFTAILLVPAMLPAQDSDKVTVLDELVISSKEGQELKKLPAAVSLISASRIESDKIESIRDLSTCIPGLFIPDYGSKYTSAVYIRGAGSRLGNSAIGMYVDNVPYLDKTAFDFDFFDIEHIEVLRGPQGTLYGRNSMGGLINVYTLSPWNFQGTKIRLSAGSYGRLKAQIAHYARLGDKFAFSVGGNYSASDGFYKNVNPKYSGKYSPVASIVFPDRYKFGNAGATQSAALRLNLGWRPVEKLSVSYTGNYEYSDQNGYAYGKYNAESNLPEEINYNDPAYYSRKVLNNSLRLEYSTGDIQFASTAGYQYLTDSLLLDQDFTSASMFTLLQTQKLNAVNEEITLRQVTAEHFRWIVGVSGFYQHLLTGSRVTFKEDGIRFIENNINEAGLSAGMPAPLELTDETIPVTGNYTTKNRGLALFVQPTLRNLPVEGLSFSAGLRLDYEHIELDHFTNSVFNYSMTVRGREIAGVKKDTLSGLEKMDFTQLLPKFSLMYENGDNMLYASLSKGYKAGGYNLQMLSDLIETKMRAQGAVAIDVSASASFRPEYSWNYEIGGRTALFDNKISASLTLFLMKISDQQITEFAPNGQGRMVKNAGKSESKGIEFEANIRPFNKFNIGLNYGFTDNRFTEYSEQTSETESVDYAGKYVPFVPRHTVSLTLDYSWLFRNAFLDRLSLGGRCSGAGKIFWTEENSVAQKFYSLASVKITLVKGAYSLSIWGNNLLNTGYSTFYFSTFGNAFGQRGKPLQAGIDLSYKL